MRRQADMAEISDGKRYSANDLVRADSGGCEGCFSCCEGMGTSVILDPCDVYEMTKGLSMSFEELLSMALELNVADGVILPNLRMEGDRESCIFLDEQGRCRIHSFRPGFCRLFPLGRIYENGSFSYFLQVHECRKKNRSKIKVCKWIGVPELPRYESFVLQWHDFLGELQEQVGNEPDGERTKVICMKVLKVFYLSPYDRERSFYDQFEERIKCFTC
ncbi:MAG: YkgJ family cysteine cluster protein [Lachnospiraceae bacterium]|jgi:Fe-S-cluster containining protein|nr:YkgJ family cysteine cluster protein [Lachnospiraceae bacterium]